MIDFLTSWSGPATIAFAGIVILGFVVGARWLLQRVKHRTRDYPDQPTIPVLFQAPPRSPLDRVPEAAPRWPPSPSSEREFDGVEMIGRRHGPRSADPLSEPRPEPGAKTGLAEAESAPAPAVSRTPKEPKTRDASEPGAADRDGAGAPEAPTPIAGPAAPSSSPIESPLRPAFDPDDTDHTLQLLPGRMEVVAGGLRGREIRFVRTDGDTYTFGRQGGTDASQIQVENATVSRQHAAMRFANGRWRIRNLSTTNPLRINGEIADVPRREYTLHDGDRVEMGEVAFLFREH